MCVNSTGIACACVVEVLESERQEALGAPLVCRCQGLECVVCGVQVFQVWEQQVRGLGSVGSPGSGMCSVKGLEMWSEGTGVRVECGGAEEPGVRGGVGGGKEPAVGAGCGGQGARGERGVGD